MAAKPEQQIYMLKEKLNDASKALEEETQQKTGLKTANDELTAELRKQKEAYTKLEKHTRNCERANTKAQKEANNAKSHVNHLINSQKGQMNSVERRCEVAVHAHKEWTDKYGLAVEKPAQEKIALQAKISEWQSKAETAQKQITSLEEQIEGTPDQIGLRQALEQWDEHQGCSVEFADLEDNLHDAMLAKQNLESDLTASKARYQKAKTDMKALQTRVGQLEQANKAFQDLQDQLEPANMNVQELQIMVEGLEEAKKKCEELQIKADQLEQANKALQDQDNAQYYTLHIQKLESDLKVSTEQGRKTEADMNALQEKFNQLEQLNEAFQDQGKADIEMLDDDMLEQEKLESDLKAAREQHQKTEADMKTLQENFDQLIQANKTFQDRDQRHIDAVQKLESDQKVSEKKCQETESNKKALQEKADRLESDLNTTKEKYETTQSNMDALLGKADQLESDLQTAKVQYQTTKSNLEGLQGRADQLESDLNATKEQYQTTRSDMEELQGKADQLEQANTTLQEKADQLESDLNVTKEQYQTTKSDLNALQGRADQLESNLNSAKEQYQTTKSDMEALQEKADQLEQANQTLQEKENKILEPKPFEKKEQDAKEPRKDPETQQLRIETPEELEHSQVTPPSSPAYTTDDGSQDLEITPRPKRSLRQDLGYSSWDQSDEEQSDVFITEQLDAMMSNQAETGEEKKADAESWVTDDPDDVEEHNRGSERRRMKKLVSMQRQAKNIDTLETRAKERAKEQSEALETLFECTPAKAKAIEWRLKALGPGCRLHEAPALVAYELSGISEETYKGLASGLLIATIPPNEVKDVGTDPNIFADVMATDTTDLPVEEVAGLHFTARDTATDTTDLPVEEVAGPHFTARDTATDTTDLPVEEVTTLHAMWSRRAFFHYFLMPLMISVILLGLYMLINPDVKPKTQHGLLYTNVYSHRHMPFSPPSHYDSTPVKFVNPPTPAAQLGIARMMKASSLGGALMGRDW